MSGIVPGLHSGYGAAAYPWERPGGAPLQPRRSYSALAGNAVLAQALCEVCRPTARATGFRGFVGAAHGRDRAGLRGASRAWPAPTSWCLRFTNMRERHQPLPEIPYLRRRMAMALCEVCRRAASCRLDGWLR